MKTVLLYLVILTLVSLSSAAGAGLERIWLTYRSHDPSRIVVNWDSEGPGDSVVCYGTTQDCAERVTQPGSDKMHHVEIPIPGRDALYFYRVSTGPQNSPIHQFRSRPTKELRVAVIANWQGRPSLDAIRQDNIHLLMTAGDNIPNLHQFGGPGAADNIEPYRQLIAAYPELFRSIPFMPALGNHDREMHPRGAKPPPEPSYDIEATAFRHFFALPDDGWKWRFDFLEFDAQFIALDLNHITDFGTTWQTCHAFQQGSPQFEWYRDLMEHSPQSFVITLYNEQNSLMRSQEKGAWGRLIQRGSAAIAGFGYFAERADLDGFSYYNTSLNGKGDRYPDPRSAFFRSEHNYVLLTFHASPREMRVELKSLTGEVLDRKMFQPRAYR